MPVGSEDTRQGSRAANNDAIPDAYRPRIAWLQLGAVIVLFGFAWPVIKISLGASTPV